MRRTFYLTLSGCAVPANAFKVGKLLAVKLDLKTVFHQMHIDLKGYLPKRKRNSLYDFYTGGLADSTEFRFSQPGLAVDTEGKIGESRRLGRAVARGFLCEHFGYRWFASIQKLMDTPQRNWTAEPRTEGDTPDLLATKHASAAIVEAKGTHRNITAKTSDVKKWRKQARNVKLCRAGKPRKLKYWIVAARWVTDQQSDLPTLFVEDPETEGAEFSEDDGETVELWGGLVHTSQNLSRIGEHRLALRFTTGAVLPSKPVQTWRCVLPGLENCRFVGTFFPRTTPFPPFWWDELRHFIPSRVWADYEREQRREQTFDGLEVNTIQQFLNGNIPEPFSQQVHSAVEHTPVSLMDDGSLLAPGELMVPDEPMTFVESPRTTEPPHTTFGGGGRVIDIE